MNEQYADMAMMIGMVAAIAVFIGAVVWQIFSSERRAEKRKNIPESSHTNQ